MRLAAAFYLVAFLTATWGQPELFPYGTDQGDEELSNCDDCNSGMVSLQHDVQMYGNNHSSYVVSLLCHFAGNVPKEKCRSVACWFGVSSVLMIMSTVSLLTVSMPRLLIERPLCQVCSWWSSGIPLYLACLWWSKLELDWGFWKRNGYKLCILTCFLSFLPSFLSPSGAQQWLHHFPQWDHGQ